MPTKIKVNRLFRRKMKATMAQVRRRISSPPKNWYERPSLGRTSNQRRSMVWKTISETLNRNAIDGTAMIRRTTWKPSKHPKSKPRRRRSHHSRRKKTASGSEKTWPSTCWTSTQIQQPTIPSLGQWQTIQTLRCPNSTKETTPWSTLVTTWRFLRTMNLLRSSTRKPRAQVMKLWTRLPCLLTLRWWRRSWRPRSLS